MFIKKKSSISGKENTMNLDITQEQIAAYAGGAYIQDAFPNLSADEREFIKTGITPTEWDEIFGGGQ